MVSDEERTIKARIERIRRLAKEGTMEDLYEAASLAQSVVQDTIGGSHPIMSGIDKAIASDSYTRILGVC